MAIVKPLCLIRLLKILIAKSINSKIIFTITTLFDIQIHVSLWMMYHTIMYHFLVVLDGRGNRDIGLKLITLHVHLHPFGVILYIYIYIYIYIHIYDLNVA